MTDLAAKYKTYRIITPFHDEVYTADVEYILKTNFQNYIKKILWVMEYSQLMATTARGRLGLAMKTTLDSILKIAFGSDVDSMCGSSEEVVRFSNAFDDARSEAKLKENVKVIDDFVYKLIKTKTQEMQKGQDEFSICFADDALPDGYHVKKGDMVAYQPYAMGRMKFIWGDDAHDFKPERWLDHNGCFRPQSSFKFTAFQDKEFVWVEYRQMKVFASILLGCFIFKLCDENKTANYKTMLNLHIDGGLNSFRRQNPPSPTSNSPPPTYPRYPATISLPPTNISDVLFPRPFSPSRRPPHHRRRQLRLHHIQRRCCSIRSRFMFPMLVMFTFPGFNSFPTPAFTSCDIITKLQDLEKENVTLGLTVRDKKPKSMSRKNETSLPDESRIIGRDSDIEKLLHKPLSSGAIGSKIILTTRKDSLLKSLGFDQLDHLNSLSHDYALSLFAQNALGVDNFVSHPTLRLQAERLGYKYFEELLSRSFFQPAPNGKALFVMHDLLTDLATSVSGDYFLRYENHTEMRKEALEKYRHMSFICDKYVAYHKFDAFTSAKSLRTLVAVSVEKKQSFYMSSKILVNLLPELPLLRVLSLSYSKITEVPKFIGSLKHLRYLNLSHTQIKELPENVGNLYNLQTLILCWCVRIMKLPNSFFKLKDLRHFDVRGTPLLKRMPFGIGELKSLRSLTKIIIGGDGGFSITELKKLKNLGGKTSIKNLEKVQNAMHAREALLSQKMITELNLEWSDVFDEYQNGSLEKEVLNELKPCSDKLKRLGIECYGGTEFPYWLGDPLFLRLVHVSIVGCGKCTSLPPLGQLPSLKELLIQQMDAVKAIGVELLGTTGVAFPSLEYLSFGYMQGWEVWSMNHRDIDEVFPCLRKLIIINCPILVEVSFEALPSLRFLEIINCGYGLLTNLAQAASLISHLHIVSISGLTNESWRCLTVHLRAVQEVRIDSCDEIRYLLESKADASKVLVNLKVLQIQNCESFLSLSEKENDCGSNLPISLSSFSICYCESMEHFICPNSIEDLSIYCCGSLTCVSFPVGGGGFKLKSLFISECSKLMEKINNTSMPMLEFVNIRCWPNLKAIPHLNNLIHLTHVRIQDCPSIESFPQIQLPNLTHMLIEGCENMDSFPALQFPNLTHLTIADCQSMKSFPDIELPNLISLKHLKINNCPSMDASFPRGIWPPNLCTLQIGKLKKPISEWGPQHFPSSFYDLELFGEHASNFSKLTDLLPSSLTSLGINNFEKLESLSMGLQHLTSLQHLSLWNCPKMRHLPKMLLPSLLSLRINFCPKLEEHTRRSGSYYWPLISHIPCIDIDYQLL
ncbi:hypothetical protein E3N88_26670 [Mikania micrantha]|uniref:NB-ARC domain-containing protein n=1 Tax=Mikania micrantha TaxID=192012 RepID=A0A5N6MUG2_9ASTR|nr:hypothetical protein E3N88_26670 [Mikania micrantha]